jgi:isoleucyl-tRNA synthetase
MPPCPLYDGGKFINPVTDFEGMYIKVCHHSLIERFGGAHCWSKGRR